MRVSYIPRAGAAGTFLYAQSGYRVLGTLHMHGGVWHPMPFRQTALPPQPTLPRAKAALRAAIAKATGA